MLIGNFKTDDLPKFGISDFFTIDGNLESSRFGVCIAAIFNFRHPDHFLAGSLNSCLGNWRTILQDSSFEDFVLPITSHGVVISNYFQQFQGTFLQQFYDSSFPPRKIFPNSKSCALFEGFIWISEQTLQQQEMKVLFIQL